MGTRRSNFAKGGGFLNGVDAEIRDYEFTDAFNGIEFESGKIKDLRGKMINRPHSLNCLLSVRVDGAEEDTTTTIKVAKEFDDWSVTDDGHTLSPNEGARLGSSSGWAKFITSWEAAFDQGAETDDKGDDTHNYESIIGSRVRLVQQEYSAEELKQIERLGAPIKRKGKDGKEYNRQSLVVEEGYELAKADGKVNGKTKTVAKVVGKVLTRGGSKSEPEEEDIKELAGTVLAEIVEAAGGKIAKTKLSLKTLTTPALKGHPQREDVRKWLYDDDNLAELVADGVIKYKKSEQVIYAAD